MHARLSPVALILIALPVAPVAAQTAASPSSATLNATTVFEQAPPPPLKLTVGTPINFGKVAIPNNAKANAVCRYQLVVERDKTVTSADMLSRTGLAVDPSNLAGCAISGASSVGIVMLACENGQTIRYGASYSSAGIKGALFRQVSRIGSIAPPDPDAQRGYQIMSDNAGSFRCDLGRDGQPAIMRINGELQVSAESDLPNGAAVNVGTVTLSVNY
ncbi:MAG: hypothetical protein ABW039_08130 [Sphingobium sp.]